MKHKLLEDAQKRLEELLKSDPRAREFQKELDLQLCHLTNPEDKFEVLMEMIKTNLTKLNKILKELKGELQ